MDKRVEQLEDAKKLDLQFDLQLDQDDMVALALHLATRDAEKNVAAEWMEADRDNWRIEAQRKEALIAELRKESDSNRMEWSAAKGAAISFRLRAEQAEAALAAEVQRHEFTLIKWFEERKILTDELVKERSALAEMTKERNAVRHAWWEIFNDATSSDDAREAELVDSFKNMKRKYDGSQSALAGAMGELAALKAQTEGRK